LTRDEFGSTIVFMYIIDGHNLIPKIPGMTLSEIDDELHLVQLLQTFCRVKGKNLDVYFDKAPVGSAGKRKYGRVTAYYVSSSITADQAIKNRLARTGRAAKNDVVVSSDREVQQSARYYRAKVMPSEEFARLLVQVLEGSDENVIESLAPNISDSEIEEYLRLFGDESS